MTVAHADEVFLDGFFSRPNLSWPDRSDSHASATYLARFLGALQGSGEVPLVLPRKDAGWPAAVAYVMCRTPGNAARVRALLEAAVAQNWCQFDGRLARLNPSDPIDACVLARFGANTTYVLRPSNPATQKELFAALSQLVATMEQRPVRMNRIVRPVGRLLRDFETSLAAGQATTSFELLEEIERTGGVSHENIAFLRIRRLGQLGEDDQILSDGALRTVVATDPPRLVREAILGAWYRANSGDDGEPVELIKRLREFPADIALLVDDAETFGDADTWAAMAVVALARGDAALARVLLRDPAEDQPQLCELLGQIPGATVGSRPPANPQLPGVDAPSIDVEGSEESHPTEPPRRETPGTTAHDSKSEGESIPAVDADAPSLDSWLAWLQSLLDGSEAALDINVAETWSVPGEADERLADAIDELPDSATGALFAGLGAFIDCDDHERPAWRAAAALIRRHLLSGSLTPSDLGAIAALLAIFLRGGPDLSAYRGLLDDLVDDDFRGRWAAVSTAPAAMDIADLVVTSPSADRAVQQGFVAAALQTLHAQRHRLPEPMRVIGDLATSDSDLAWDWSVDEVAESTASTGAGREPASILLYSLEEAVLARAKSAVERMHPGIQVALSSAKVGSVSLREHARRADLIVLATRRAAHAATGFIQAHTKSARIEYADGCGSASMLRAIEQGIRLSGE